MSDITKCPGEGCSIRASCRRFTAKANPDYQSVQQFDPWEVAGCFGFLPAEGPGSNANRNNPQIPESALNPPNSATVLSQTPRNTPDTSTQGEPVSPQVPQPSQERNVTP
jgi:hypothetical protein